MDEVRQADSTVKNLAFLRIVKDVVQHIMQCTQVLNTYPLSEVCQILAFAIDLDKINCNTRREPSGMNADKQDFIFLATDI